MDWCRCHVSANERNCWSLQLGHMRVQADLIKLIQSSVKSDVSTNKHSQSKKKGKTNGTRQQNSSREAKIQMGKGSKHNHTRLRCSLSGMNGKRFPEQTVASECECVSKPQESAVWLADGLWAERGSATLFSCNNAIPGPARGDTGERRQQPRHAKY